jgi:acyl-CoA synthetase (AMP-forming)/AMP-acid ligase II
VTLNDRELLEFIRRKMADYKVPRQILFLAALPRNATGKILKTTLRELPAV